MTAEPPRIQENPMIPHRPIPPLSPGPRSGWKSVVAAVVMAALLGTTATSAVAAVPESGESSVSAPRQATPAASSGDVPIF
ncbi:hypothetical protein GU243_17560 [Pseudarthrobacter psychrotolerans]|uniref:Uncharacterized protein n=1 Tax=Pseudarthrobacter psychrotolerans TaxID=2697569 RepID=A0A6P1NQ59_9MICC|nr:hypothetical protein [Pseudarthrobacter psychrotolerans]QHK21213.1 hypothetical protein GU243_17560 [Pseudarthrobacter psychrotolerans]